MSTLVKRKQPAGFVNGAKLCVKVGSYLWPPHSGWSPLFCNPPPSRSHGEGSKQKVLGLGGWVGAIKKGGVR